MQKDRLASITAVILTSLLAFSVNVIPSNAASVLAAWIITSDGVLKFRTASGAKLEAFFQKSSGDNGDRVWIDFPGELSKPRKILGNGPIKEIRLGKPYKDRTRLVIEFKPTVSLNPNRLRLLGTSENLWELPFLGVNTSQLRSIGEGNILDLSNKTNLPTFDSTNINRKYHSSYLPNVQRGKFKIIIDPGHGGPDSGAVGINGLKETDVVLEISKYVSKYLSEKGVYVELTRYREKDVSLTERVLIANRSNANAFISIHANATRGFRRDISGIETYYYTGYRGKNLASNIQKEILKVSGGSPDRGVRQSRFFVIKNTNMPAALVEVGFVTGRLDARLLEQSIHRKRIAFAIAKGILSYLKETY